MSWSLYLNIFQPPMYGGMGQMVSSQMPGGLMGRQPNMMGTGMYMPQGGMQQVPAQVQQINQIQLNQVSGCLLMINVL